ncbi:DUF4856 domain-containing protein [Halocola ammonii]
MINKWTVGILSAALMLTACSKDDENTPEENVDTGVNCEANEYCFTDGEGNLTVSYSGQIARLNQMEELTSYMKEANTPGISVDAATMKEMFSNNNGNGSTHFSSEAAVAGKQLKNKCFLGTVNLYEAYMDSLAMISVNSSEGSNGTAGVVTSTANPDKKYLLNANGFEYTQLIEKGLMGDVFYYQAIETYIVGVEDGAYDNSSTLEGEFYTEMEHKFDEAFGYFGAPQDFLENPGNARFHAKYCNSRNDALETNEAIFNAFIGARTNISADDLGAAQIEMDEIRLQWHRVVAGTAISYLKGATQNMMDPAIKCHQLSEAYAFIGNLLHNAPYNLSPDQVQIARDYMGDNFYETTIEDIENTIGYLVNNTEITLAELADI